MSRKPLHKTGMLITLTCLMAKLNASKKVTQGGLNLGNYC